MEDIILTGKRIIAGKSRLIYNRTPDGNWLDDWKIMAGEWKCENGCLIGKEYGNKGGILLYRQFFESNVMISFNASTVLPATRDVNAVFCADWDYKNNDLGDSYVCGINGWYDGKSGIERNAKDNRLVFRSLSATACGYVPGSTVRMTAGSIDGHCFMTVDGKLAAEHIEYENYLKSGYVGFSPFCTILKISNIEIREIFYERFSQKYEPEFK